MNVLIWYNAKDQVYQSGTMKDMEKVMAQSMGEKNLQVLYEFNDASNYLIDRMLYSLNSLKLPNH